jgi:long-chain acyl-CoA synthetase
MNVAERLERNARQYPEVPAILFEGKVIGYAALDRQVNRLAGWLASTGVRAGDRVALFLPNLPAFCVAYFAAQKVGAVVVSVGAPSRGPEVHHALEHSEAVVLFTTAALAGEVSGRAALPQLRAVVVCDGESPAGPSLESVTARRAERFATVARGRTDPAAILYTSGTTGKPKGAVLSHGNITFNSQATAACVGARAGDRHLLFLPLFHCFGQNFIMNTALATGGTLVLQRRFELEATLGEVARHDVTHFYGVPTVFIRALEAGVPAEGLAGVRYFFSAAATMPTGVASAWRARFERPICEGYGLTETSPFASYNHTRRYKLGSVGAPVEGVEMKIADEQGRPREPRAWGEICIKGPNVMAGYFRDEAATRQAVRDGWFHSGDIGYRDEEGDYFIVDRLKDMINCAGFKVWPREVEEALYQHPAVEECAVTAGVDPVRGESVRAFIKARQPVSPEALRHHCESRMARYKIPSEFVFDRPIPRNPAGKILKRLLREQAP